MQKGLMVTTTCIQTMLPAPLPLVQSRVKELSAMYGNRELTKEDVFTEEELYGQIFNVYEVSLKPELYKKYFLE